MQHKFEATVNIGPLPADVLDIIFEEICNDESTLEGWRKGGPEYSSERRLDISELTAVCRQWRGLAQRYLFRYVVYSFSRPPRSDESPWDEGTDERWTEIYTGIPENRYIPCKSLESFTLFLAKNARLAHAIRYLRLRCQIAPSNPLYLLEGSTPLTGFDLEDSDKVDPHVFFKLVKLLPQLRELHLWNVVLTQPLVPLPLDNLISLNGVYICHSVAHASAEDVCNLLPCFGEVDELTVVKLGSWQPAHDEEDGDEEEVGDDEGADNDDEVDDEETSDVEGSLDEATGGAYFHEGDMALGGHLEHREDVDDADADDVEVMLDADGADGPGTEDGTETEDVIETEEETEEVGGGGGYPAGSGVYDSEEDSDTSEERPGAPWNDVWFPKKYSHSQESPIDAHERLRDIPTDIYTYEFEGSPEPSPALPELRLPDIAAPGLKIRSLGLSQMYASPEAILRQILHSPSRETITRLVFCEIPPQTLDMGHLQTFTNALGDRITEVRWLLMHSEMLDDCLEAPQIETRFSMVSLTKLQRLTFGLSFLLGEPYIMASLASTMYDILTTSYISPKTHPDLKEIVLEMSSFEWAVPSLSACRSDWWLGDIRSEGLNDSIQNILLQTVKVFELPYIVFECIDIMYHDNDDAIVTARQLESLAAQMFYQLRDLQCLKFRPAQGNVRLPLGIWQSVDVSRDVLNDVA